MAQTEAVVEDKDDWDKAFDAAAIEGAEKVQTAPVKEEGKEESPEEKATREAAEEKAAADAKMKADADAQATAEAKVRSDAEAKVAAEVKAKVDADAKAAADADRKAKAEVMSKPYEPTSEEKAALDVLKKAGVDLGTSKPVEETFAVMEGYIDRLEELVG